jgi:L-lactate dehydrogenase complex protein LldG
MNEPAPLPRDTRALVLQRVRANQPPAAPLPPPLQRSPDFEPPTGALWPRFCEALARMGGRTADAPAGSVDEAVRQLFPQARVIVSATPEAAGTRPLPADGAPHALDDVDVGIVRAAFGIAETGSVALGERELGINALGFLSQHLVVLLDPEAIVPGVQDAYRLHARFFDARYAVLMTGPTATADIEGVLVRGAQGIRTLTVMPFANGMHGS